MYEIEAKNIKKSFGNLEVLKSISLQVNKGEVVAILGSSGSGKSTFLRCLNYLESINKGEITIYNDVLKGGKKMLRQLRYGGVTYETKFKKMAK